MSVFIKNTDEILELILNRNPSNTVKDRESQVFLLNWIDI